MSRFCFGLQGVFRVPTFCGTFRALESAMGSVMTKCTSKRRF